MEEYEYGQCVVGLNHEFSHALTSRDLELFEEITQDHNPLHRDPAYASTTPFKRPVAYGLLVQSFLSRLVGEFLPGKRALILAVDSQFRKPCFEGDTITVRGTIERRIEAGNLIIIATAITNQHNDMVQSGRMTVQVRP